MENMNFAKNAEMFDRTAVERFDSITAEKFDSAVADAGAHVGVPNWAHRELQSEKEESVAGRHGFDVPFFVIALLILLFGVIMVFSASFARSYYMSGDPMWFFSRQAIFAVIGVASMLIVSRIPTRVMSRFSVHLLLVSIFLLVLVLMIGLTINGARRWIGFGGAGDTSLTFQPSEVAKLAVIMAFAQIMCKFGKKMKSFKFGVLPFAVVTMFLVVLLYRQPHISAIIIIATIASVMMLAGGTQLRWFLLLGIFLLTLVSAIILPRMYAPVRYGEPPLTVSEAVIDASRGMGYAGERISAWLDPDADPLNAGFQTRQSLLAIGSGGLFGQGLGQSRQKFLYLPEEHNDFIFAVISEELGFIGALLILTLFTLLIIRGYWLSFQASDKYGSLIVFGITSLLAIQVFFNVAVVTNIIPATGISLPFFSYGGTALLLQLVQIGIVLSVSREIGMERPKKRQESEQENG